MAFIISSYNKYDSFDRERARYVFEMNGQEYAVKEVELEWGQPRLPINMYREQEKEPYAIYGTLEEALVFIHSIRLFY